MLGFTEGDVEEMLNYYQSVGLIKHDPGYLKEIIDGWYGNYLFSKHAKVNERLYNSDMVLYFLKEYFKIQSLPDDLIDRNVRMDYEKLKHLIMVDKGDRKVSNGNFDRLKDIIKEGEISSELAKGFPLEELAERENFISLLFYFGLLTIKTAEAPGMIMEIPNETIRRFYYNYIKEGYADIVMEPFLARYEGLKYSYILELKYIKAKEGKKIDLDTLQQLKAAAVEQLKNYSIDEKFRKTIEKTNLIKIALIFSGHELLDKTVVS
jgi:hypothetical protein